MTGSHHIRVDPDDRIEAFGPGRVEVGVIGYDFSITASGADSIRLAIAHLEAAAALAYRDGAKDPSGTALARIDAALSALTGGAS